MKNTSNKKPRRTVNRITNFDRIQAMLNNNNPCLVLDGYLRGEGHINEDDETLIVVAFDNYIPEEIEFTKDEINRGMIDGFEITINSSGYGEFTVGFFTLKPSKL
jgi:hypothetical protein